MPRCPSGSKRCPPKTGKCYRSKSAKNKTVKRTRTSKKSSGKKTSGKKLSWIQHLKMCSKKFNIKYGEAMSDPRCVNLYRHGHE
jgi:hypothetical protein